MTTSILVSGVREDTIDTAMEPLRNSIPLRVWWENETSAAIITLIPGHRHEVTAGRFITSLTSKILQIPGHNDGLLVIREAADILSLGGGVRKVMAEFGVPLEVAALGPT